MNSNELYDKIGLADKFKPADGPPVGDHSAQVQTGMDWAARQAQRPEPAPPTMMPPIVPVAN